MDAVMDEEMRSVLYDDARNMSAAAKTGVDFVDDDCRMKEEVL